MLGITIKVVRNHLVLRKSSKPKYPCDASQDPKYIGKATGATIGPGIGLPKTIIVPEKYSGKTSVSVPAMIVYTIGNRMPRIIATMSRFISIIQPPATAGGSDLDLFDSDVLVRIDTYLACDL